MSDSRPLAGGSGRLAAAQRCFDLRLREARLAQTEADAALARANQERSVLEGELAGLEGYARDLMTGRGLDAALLESLHRYARWIAGRLDAQVAAVEAAERDCADKTERTRACYEDIAVLERVAERRSEERRVEHERVYQRSLDAHAILKLSAAILRGDPA